jgi:hypothetical protein
VTTVKEQAEISLAHEQLSSAGWPTWTLSASSAPPL